VELPSYRGDIINELAFAPEARIPDPLKMTQAYTQSAATLNLLRAFSKGGYADVHQVHSWTLGFTESERAAEYRNMANRISDALDFMSAAGIASHSSQELRTVDFYVSHEALLLNIWKMAGRIGPSDLDRRSHPPARWGACRILPRRSKSDRAKMWTNHHR
jgi:3-deoxy-7-phosphoheptulonate synthase